MRLMLFSIRDTGDEGFRHFPEELRKSVTVLPPPPELTAEVESMKSRRELPQSVVLTLREWGDRPDKARVYEAAWIGRKLRAAGVRHVHTHFAGVGARTAWWIRQFYGCSYSFTGHANDLFCPDETPDLKLPRLIADASCVIAVSDYTAQWLRERHPASAGRIHRVYNGLDLEPISRVTRSAPKIKPPLILSVGRLIEKKGFSILIRACDLLRDQGLDFQCRIVGEGPLEDTLSRQIAEAGLEGKVILEGPQTMTRIVELLGQAAVFALPCVTGADGGRDVLPTVIMEAMAAGLPCVSSRLAGVPEMVTEGTTGILTDEGDIKATAAALGKLLVGPDSALLMGAAGRQSAGELFSQKATASHLRRTLTSYGKVNGWPPSANLLVCRAEQSMRMFSRNHRPPTIGKQAVFP